MSASFSILIVDDNPSMATALADILALKGFETYVAQSGAQALQVLHAHPIDILLTDAIMPGMDGLALYRQTRQAWPHLTTILMTAYAADDIIQQGMAEGIRTVLTKPLDIDFLIHLLSALKNLKFPPT
jgi:CheY-like chemotaxis protein